MREEDSSVDWVKVASDYMRGSNLMLPEAIIAGLYGEVTRLRAKLAETMPKEQAP